MASRNIREINDNNFEAEVINSSLPVLVQFKATWCGPCKALAPIVQRIADDFEEKLKVCVIDIDESPDIPQRYGVRSVPTVLIFRNGRKYGQHIGLTSYERLVRLLE
jgi:thioredoxin 1